MEPEAHVAELIAALQEARAAVLAAQPNARVLACWDLDGTLLRGDCTDGLIDKERPVYHGLAQLAIEAGLAADYDESDGHAEFHEDYGVLLHRFGPWLAYRYLAQVFAGAEESALVALAERHFADTLRPHFFASSRAIFDALAALGVEQHVISANPEFFVRGAAGVLGVPPAQLHGIGVRVVDGKVTRDLLAPVPLAEGKCDCLKAILAAPTTGEAGRPTYVLAGFGDSFTTDGPLLRQIAAQELPGTKALTVMVNGGVPPQEYRRQFRGVRHTRTVGAA